VRNVKQEHPNAHLLAFEVTPVQIVVLALARGNLRHAKTKINPRRQRTLLGIVTLQLPPCVATPAFLPLAVAALHEQAAFTCYFLCLGWLAFLGIFLGVCGVKVQIRHGLRRTDTMPSLLIRRSKRTRRTTQSGFLEGRGGCACVAVGP
jgi:hypothetical protein